MYVVSTASTSSTSSREEVAPAGVFSRLLDCLTSALLVRTLSRLSHSESINPAQTRLSLYTGESEDRLLFAYLDLWTELLYPKDKHIRALLMRFYAPSYETHFAQRLYAGLLEQVLHLLGTLDLSYVFISNGVAGDEGGSGADAAADRVLVPSNIADQDVLLNLVAFLEALLPSGEDWFPGNSSLNIVFLFIKRFGFFKFYFVTHPCFFIAIFCRISDCVATAAGAESGASVQRAPSAFCSVQAADLCAQGGGWRLHLHSAG